MNMHTSTNSENIVWSSEAVDRGAEAEKDFETVVRDILQVKEVPKNLNGVNVYDQVVFRKADVEEDTEKGVDFYFYDPRKKEWVPVDITTARNPHVLNDKLQKERDRGVRILAIPGGVLERARRGSERDILEVYEKIKSVFDS